MVSLFYKPLGALIGALGGVLAGALFKRIWKLVTREPEAPKATDPDRRWPQVLAAATAQGAVFALVKAVVDRGGATAFHKATGVWPAKPAKEAA